MPSAAFAAWQSTGLARLGELETVHAQVSSGGSPPSWSTAQLERVLFVALLAQFQAFCRELHDEAVNVHLAAAIPGQRAVLRALLVQDRNLDVRNPSPSALGADFGRLGFRFIDDLKRAGANDQLTDLGVLVEYRNAVGHGNEAQIAALEATGAVAATEASYRRHRSSVERLAGTMDVVVADQLAALLGVMRPW